MAGCASSAPKNAADDSAAAPDSVFQDSDTPGSSGTQPPGTARPGSTAGPGASAASVGGARGGGGGGGKPTKQGTAAAGTEADAAAGDAGSNTGSSVGSRFTGPAKGEPVRVGMQYLSDTEGTSQTFGAPLATGDNRKQAKTVADWINARGGIRGRPLEYVFHGVSSGDYYNDREGASEKTCVAFTQDNKLYAASILYTNPNLVGCLADAGVLVTAATYPQDAEVFQRYSRYFYMPAAMNVTRANKEMVAQLTASTFLPRNAKVGIGFEDTPQYRRVAAALKADLKARGISVVAEFGENRDDFSTVPSQNQNAVVQFRQAGVTHVLFADGGGSVALYFMLAADNQRWFPKYGLGTQNAINVLELYVPESQLVNVQGMSYFVADSAGVAEAGNATAKLCMSIFKQAGVSTGASRSVTEQLAVGICDNALFLADVSGAADALSAEAFQAVVDRGTVFRPSASTFATKYGKGRHDGVAAVRMVAWNPGTKRWKWISNVIPVS